MHKYLLLHTYEYLHMKPKLLRTHFIFFFNRTLTRVNFEMIKFAICDDNSLFFFAQFSPAHNELSNMSIICDLQLLINEGFS